MSFAVRLLVMSLYPLCIENTLRAGPPVEAPKPSHHCDLNSEIDQITLELGQIAVVEEGKNEPGLSLAFIPYRSEKGGKAAFYDHYTFQKLTGHGSFSDANPDQLKEFREYLSEIDVNLSMGDLDPSTKRLLPFTKANAEEDAGLLLIPGRSRANEFDPERTQRENESLQRAMNRGQPILAICAGCTQLWEKCGGRSIAVKDHNYNGGMLRLGKGGRTVYNVQIHDVVIQKNSLLSNAMGLNETSNPSGDFEILVNSVHWKSPDESSLPSSLLVCARTKKNPEITLKSRQSTLMSPQENTVEAFESRFGAPILGIQWHPEGYNADDLTHPSNKKNRNFAPKAHIQLLCFMAQAGDAYRAKRRMLRELLQLQ